MILADLLRRIEEWIPPALAAEWDNVGLLLGDPSSNIDKAMTCLTVTPESAITFRAASICDDQIASESCETHPGCG